MKTEVIHTTTKKRIADFIIFFPYFELFRTIDVFLIQTLIITLLRNVMLTDAQRAWATCGEKECF